jgi:hypothetical protein
MEPKNGVFIDGYKDTECGNEPQQEAEFPLNTANTII